MNQQPDKLFREKLEGYNRPVPASAWDKIDAGLQKKNNKGPGLMWKIAASLLLFAVVTYVVWPTADELPKPLATKQNDGSKSVESKETQPAIATEEKSAPATQPALHPKETVRHTPKNKVDKPKEEVLQKNISEEIKTPTEGSPVAIQAEEKSNEKLPTIETKSEAIAINTSTPEHTTIIVTAKEADEYLNKKELAQATSKEKKPSTLKKLLKKADDLTNDQDPFGELRQKKNEILALNFKTDKQREQNK